MMRVGLAAAVARIEPAGSTARERFFPGGEWPRIGNAVALPSTERRRMNRLSRQLLDLATLLPASLLDVLPACASVIGTAYGDGDILVDILEPIALGETPSPSKFHNSVHNAPGAYWTMAVKSHAASTTVSCAHSTLAACLLESASQVLLDGCCVVCGVTDLAFPEILKPLRIETTSTALLCVLTPVQHGLAQRTLDLSLSWSNAPSETPAMTTKPDLQIEALFAAFAQPRGRVLLPGGSHQLAIEVS